MIENSPSTPSLSELYTAIHESGHAVVGWYFGMTIQMVSIQSGRHPDGTECGGITKSMFPDSERVEAVNHRMFTLPRVLELFAGRAAIDCLCPDMPPGNGHCHDFDTIKSLLAPDEEILQMHKWRTEHPDSDTEDFYQEFKPLLLDIINSSPGRRAIKALSRSLLKERQLSGCLAVEIMEKTWGEPLPPWALPAEMHKSIVEEGPRSFADAMNEILVYMSLLKKKILPWRDSEKNTPLQNETIQRIANNILEIQFLAIGPLPEEPTEGQPSQPS